MKENDLCILCLKKTDIRGIFYPNEQFLKEYKIKNNARFFYAVCQDCLDKQESNDRIEKFIIYRITEFGIPGKK